MTNNNIKIKHLNLTKEELDQHVDDYCAVSQITNLSYEVDEENQRIAIVAEDRHDGSEYDEFISFDEFVEYIEA